MITGAKLKSEEDFKKMWVITASEKGKKTVVSEVTGSYSDVEKAFETGVLHISPNFPICSVRDTVPLMESLEEAQKALDVIKRVHMWHGMTWAAEPATDILTVGWTMNTDEETGAANFIPIFFPKQMDVKVSTKEEVRKRSYSATLEKIEKLQKVASSILRAV